MSHRSTVFAAALLALATAAPLAAQQDTGMMQHDSAMMGHGSAMGHDSAMMGHEDKMKRDEMGKIDSGGNMMFMGTEGQKAAGDYEITETGGKRRLTLTNGFAVAEAPDLHLILARGDVPDNQSLDLGKIKATGAGQTFDLPKGKDLSGFTRLLVWSKKEKRAVASAEWHVPAEGSMEHM
jgi:Electron transfer DM13